MRRPLITFGTVLAAGIISLGSGSVSIAQEELMTEGGALPGPHPAHIHAGSCPDVGEVVIPLNDVASSSQEVMGTPAAGSSMASPMASPMAESMTAIPVRVSVTTVDVAMTDILAGEHAINIHESAENIGNYIACGGVNAMPWDDTSVLFGIAPQNNSGFSGVGSLYDNGDGTTTVYIYLTHGMGMTGSDMATPVASPAS